MAPRRGYKACPKCDKEVGVRTKICSCGTVFVSKKAAAASRKQSRVESMEALSSGGPPPFKAKAPAGGPPPFTPKVTPKFHVVRVTDRAAVQRFITDLKAALKQSTATSGCYSAFIHSDVTSTPLQIEVHVK